MKKGLLLLMIAATGLVGCTPSGKIKCSQIAVLDGSGTVFEEESNTTYSEVYEYESEEGKTIYTSDRYRTYVWNGSVQEVVEYSIRTYKNRYTDDFTEYSYSRFVGYLTEEFNFYLDLNKRTIDAETKWTEYKELNNPVEDLENPVNNKEAYQCAKKGYYQSDSVSTGGSSYVSIYLDSADSSLNRHIYGSVGQGFAIMYTVKK